MNTKPRPYPLSKLPPGFVYPKAFLDLLASSEHSDLNPPWWLVDAESQVGELFLQAVSKLQKPWVPFAKTDGEDDIACFDASSMPGDPFVAVLASTPDTEYGFRNFDEWLRQAKRDAAKWKARARDV